MIGNEFIPFPSFAVAQPLILQPEATGGLELFGSRLIPKALLQNPTSRKEVVDVISTVQKRTTPITNIEGHLVAGGPPVSHSSDSAINPAWRTACLHMLVFAPLSENSTQAEIQQIKNTITNDLVEPMRQITPGGGAYMNEADSNAPYWKEDFFGANYDRLLSIKLKYDPEHLLSCNRCVGSDL